MHVDIAVGHCQTLGRALSRGEKKTYKSAPYCKAEFKGIKGEAAQETESEKKESRLYIFNYICATHSIYTVSYEALTPS